MTKNITFLLSFGHVVKEILDFIEKNNLSIT